MRRDGPRLSRPNNRLSFVVEAFGGTMQASRIGAFCFQTDAEAWGLWQSTMLAYKGVRIDLYEAGRWLKSWQDGQEKS